MRIFRRLWLVAFALIAPASMSVQAQGPNIQHFRPSMPHQNLVQTLGSQPLTETFAISFFANYVDQPLEFVSDGELNFIESIVTYDLNMAFSVSPRLTMGVSIPFSTLVTPNNALSTLVRERALGDVLLTGLWTIRKRLGTNGFGLAIAPEIYVPTGNENDFMGHTSFGFAGRLIADWSKENLYTSINLGAVKRFDNAVLANIDIQDQWTLALGSQYNFDKMIVGAEFIALTDLTAPFQSEVQSPMEVSTFVAKPVRDGLRIYTGASMGILQGYGNATWRLYAGIRKTFADKPQKTGLEESTLLEIKKQVASIMPVSQPKTATTQGLSRDDFEDMHIHFEHDKNDLIPESMYVLRQLARYLQTHPEQQLTLIGHADAMGDETYNHHLALKRAERVKAFLVMQRIEQQRITVQSKGELEPVVAKVQSDYDKLLNRRVEIQWSLPLETNP